MALINSIVRGFTQFMIRAAIFLIVLWAVLALFGFTGLIGWIWGITRSFIIWLVTLFGLEDQAIIADWIHNQKHVPVALLSNGAYWDVVKAWIALIVVLVVLVNIVGWVLTLFGAIFGGMAAGRGVRPLPTPGGSTGGSSTTTTTTAGGNTYHITNNNQPREYNGAFLAAMLLGIVVLFGAAMWLPGQIHDAIHGVDTRTTAQRMNKDAAVAKVKLCGDENFFPDTVEEAKACFGAWLVVRDYPEMKESSAAIAARLGAVCAAYYVGNSNGDQQTLALEMARNGLPCPVSVVADAKQIDAEAQSKQAVAQVRVNQPQPATGIWPSNIWLQRVGFILAVLTVGAVVTLLIRSIAGGSVWPLNRAMVPAFLVCTLGVLFIGLYIA